VTVNGFAGGMTPAQRSRKQQRRIAAASNG